MLVHAIAHSQEAALPSVTIIRTLCTKEQCAKPLGQQIALLAVPEGMKLLPLAGFCMMT